MNRKAVLLWITTLLTACAPLAGPHIKTADDVLSALEEAGATVAETEMLALPTLGGVGHVWQVNRSIVQITEFESEAARQEVSEQISPDGLSLSGRPLVWSDRPQIWAIGRVIVTYVGTDGPTIVLLSGLLGDPLTPQEGMDAPYPPAVTAAIAALAEESGIDPALVQVVSFEEVEWPDACLGAPRPGEGCAEVVTPGWRVTLRAGDETVEVHTDEVGMEVRWR